MDVRRLILKTVICLYAMSFLTYAVTSPTEMLVVPKAITPDSGDLFYGAKIQVFQNESNEFDNRKVFFYKYSLTNNFQMGMKVTEDFDTLFSLHAELLTFGLFSMTHSVGVGSKNLGWDRSSQLDYSLPILGDYAVYTVAVPKWRSKYHSGLVQYRNGSGHTFVAGAEYSFKNYITSAEWDGKQVHFGFLYHLFETKDLYVSLTPAPYEGFGNLLHNLSVAYIFKGNFFPKKEKIKKLSDEYDQLNTRLDVLDAKLDVLREFSSVDFLEEFQQFLLQEHMVEKDMSEERNITIKLALDHMQRGLEYYYRGHYDKALQEYQNVTTMVPNFSIGFARLGSIYYKLGDLKNAKYNWEKALQLNPSNKSLKVFLERVSAPEQDIDKEIDLDKPKDEFQILNIIPERDKI